jgi:hypothetical protein
MPYDNGCEITKERCFIFKNVGEKLVGGWAVVVRIIEGVEEREEGY